MADTPMEAAVPVVHSGAADESGFAASMDTVREQLNDREIVIVKQVFDPDRIRTARDAVFDWGQSTPPTDGELSELQNFHRIDREGYEKFPHLFHFYGFYDLVTEHRPEARINTVLRPIYERLCRLHNVLHGTDRSLTRVDDGSHFHPQVLQYPSGGGYLAGHTHTLDPMRFGIVVPASERGSAYEAGGTRFYVGDRFYDTDSAEIGDVVLFRHDVFTTVMPIDPAGAVDWNAKDGRWAIVMPYQ